MDNNNGVINKEELEAAQNFRLFHIPSKIPHKKQKRILIFTNPEKTAFIEFYHNPYKNIFYCKGCTNVRPCVPLILVEDPENPRKKRIKFINEEEEKESSDEEEKPAKVATRRSSRKRVNRFRATAADEEDAEGPSIKKNRRENFNLVVDAENYEVVQVPRYNGVIQRLLIYTSPERTECYEFNYNRHVDWYHCRSCLSKHYKVSVKLFKDEAEDKMKFRLGHNDHICEPVQAERMKTSMESSATSPNGVEIKAEPTPHLEEEGPGIAQKKPRKRYERKKKSLEADGNGLNEGETTEEVKMDWKPPAKNYQRKSKKKTLHGSMDLMDGSEPLLDENFMEPQYYLDEIEWVPHNAMEQKCYQQFANSVWENLKRACDAILQR